MFGKAANCSSVSEALVSDKQLMFRYVAQHGPIFFCCALFSFKPEHDHGFACAPSFTE